MKNVRVENITFLFSDLKGSAAIYDRLGDRKAFELVQKHFEILEECVRAHGGSIVKTIGDSIMATFTSPCAALGAALLMQGRVERLNHRFRQPEHRLKLKVGIHCGSCFAVKIHDRMDFFGGSVNIAARAGSLCLGGDIMISARTMELRELRIAVEEQECLIERIACVLKGIRGQFELYRIQCA